MIPDIFLVHDVLHYISTYLVSRELGGGLGLTCRDIHQNLIANLDTWKCRESVQNGLRNVENSSDHPRRIFLYFNNGDDMSLCTNPDHLPRPLLETDPARLCLFWRLTAHSYDRSTSFRYARDFSAIAHKVLKTANHIYIPGKQFLVLDSYDKWYPAVVLDIDEHAASHVQLDPRHPRYKTGPYTPTPVLFHFCSWGNRWDEWIDVSTFETTRVRDIPSDEAEKVALFKELMRGKFHPNRDVRAYGCDVRVVMSNASVALVGREVWQRVVAAVVGPHRFILPHKMDGDNDDDQDPCETLFASSVPSYVMNANMMESHLVDSTALSGVGEDVTFCEFASAERKSAKSDKSEILYCLVEMNRCVVVVHRTSGGRGINWNFYI